MMRKSLAEGRASLRGCPFRDVLVVLRRGPPVTIKFAHGMPRMRKNPPSGAVIFKKIVEQKSEATTNRYLSRQPAREERSN